MSERIEATWLIDGETVAVSAVTVSAPVGVARGEYDLRTVLFRLSYRKPDHVRTVTVPDEEAAADHG